MLDIKEILGEDYIKYIKILDLVHSLSQDNTQEKINQVGCHFNQHLVNRFSFSVSILFFPKYANLWPQESDAAKKGNY